MNKFKELFERMVNLDRGGSPEMIAVGDTVVLNKNPYKCVEKMKDMFSYVLEDKDGNKYLFDSLTNDLAKI